MKITLKIKFNTSDEKFEAFGNGMYLVYLPFKEDDDSVSVLSSLLSRKIGVSPNRIDFAGIDGNRNWIFELL